MKKILTLLTAVSISASLFAQQSNVPNAVTFQGVARDNSNNIVVNQNIDVALIYQYGVNGPMLYNCDYHQLTDTFGEFTILISDTSSNLVGNCTGFSSIPWDTGNIYLTVKYSTNGGGTYTLLGTIPISSTYYSFVSRTSNYANKADTANYATQSALVANMAIYYAQYSAVWATGWNVVALDGVQSVFNSSISLSGDTVTLQPGQYVVQGYVTGFNGGQFLSALYNYTKSNLAVYGSWVQGGSGSILQAPICGEVNVAGTAQQFLLKVNTLATSGASMGDSSFDPAVWAALYIQKVQ